MGEKSRVTVKIYGQEYTIAGGDSGERMAVVAGHVDSLMNELARGLPSMSVSSLAVLTAVNVADDLFEARDRISELQRVVADLRKDSEHYVRLWEDAKASFKQYKEDAKNSVEQLQELQRIFNLKNVELNQAVEEAESLREEAAALREQLKEAEQRSSRISKAEEELEIMQSLCDESQAEAEKLKARIQELENQRSSQSKDASEIQEKYKELESSFFDIQMENIQLKNELDHLKKAGAKGRNA